MQPSPFLWSRHRSPLVRWASAAVALLMLAGCGAIDASDEELAVICSNDAAICLAWAQGYTELTGRPVTMERLPTTEALERILRGDGLAEYDVWHGGGSEMHIAAAEAGLLEPYVSPRATGIPPLLRDPAGGWTGVYASVLAFCIDPQALEDLGIERPETWDDLLASQLTGQISASSPRTSGTAYTTMTVQTDRLGPDGGREYLRALYGQVLQFTRSGTAPARVLARGEAAVAITFAPYCEAAGTDGRPLEIIHPADATGYEVGAISILADAPHPGSARDYVDFAVSAVGQRSGDDSGIYQIPTDSALDGNITTVLEEGTYPVVSSTPLERAAQREDLLDWFTREIQV